MRAKSENKNAMKLRTTIVISSFGRQKEILRYVNFLKMYPVNLIIVDGSKTVLDIELSGCSSDFRFKYFNLQGENKYLDRVILGISNVESKYFCLMDDTDIILPSSLSIIEKWLDKKSNYFANGQVWVLSKQEQNISIDEWGYWSKPLVAKENSPLQRIKSVIECERTANLIYSVVPSKFIREIIFDLRLAQKINQKMSKKHSEMVIVSAFLKKMKYQKLDLPFWIRTNLFLSKKSFQTDYSKLFTFTDDEYRFLVSFFKEILGIAIEDSKRLADIYRANFARGLQKSRDEKSNINKIKLRIKMTLSKSKFIMNIYFLFNQKKKNYGLPNLNLNLDVDLINLPSTETCERDMMLALSCWYFKRNYKN